MFFKKNLFGVFHWKAHGIPGTGRRSEAANRLSGTWGVCNADISF